MNLINGCINNIIYLVTAKKFIKLVSFILLGLVMYIRFPIWIATLNNITVTVIIFTGLIARKYLVGMINYYFHVWYNGKKHSIIIDNLKNYYDVEGNLDPYKLIKDYIINPDMIYIYNNYILDMNLTKINFIEKQFAKNTIRNVSKKFRKLNMDNGMIFKEKNKLKNPSVSSLKITSINDLLVISTVLSMLSGISSLLLGANSLYTVFLSICLIIIPLILHGLYHSMLPDFAKEYVENINTYQKSLSYLQNMMDFNRYIFNLVLEYNKNGLIFNPNISNNIDDYTQNLLLIIKYINIDEFEHDFELQNTNYLDTNI